MIRKIEPRTGHTDTFGREIYGEDIVVNEHDVRFQIIWSEKDSSWRARIEGTTVDCILRSNVFEIIDENEELPN